MLDDNNVAVPGARISIGAVETVSASTGTFRARLPGPGRYLISVRREGFFSITARPLDIGANPQELHLILNHVREVFQSVDVTAAEPPVNTESTTSEQKLTNLQILDVPFPSTRSLTNALRLMPGVIQDPSGELHFNGSAENQVQYTLDGFNINDPLTNRFNARVSVDSVRAAEYDSGRYSPEFGKGSAGALAIRTDMGTDAWRYNATNFVPGLDTRKGLHLGTWSPRFGVTGPIWKGRAWFSDYVDGEYSVNVVPDLPAGQDRTTSLRLNNILRGQVNVRPNNILYGDFLVNYFNAPHTGLSALDPLSTTIDQRSRTYFFSLKDQIYLGRGTLLEVGAAQNRTFTRQVPQGDAFYEITPEGHAGNYFADTSQIARRDQVLANLFLPKFHQHEIKLGIDLDRLTYEQDARRTGFQLYGVSGALVRQVTFAGSGTLSRPSAEASSYIVDDWKARHNVMLEFGLRQDWDELVRKVLLSPRASFSWAPLRDTKVSGGYAVTYDATPLELFARPLDQYAIDTTFVPYTQTITRFVIPYGQLQAPRYQNWSLGAERQFPRRVHVSANLLRKRGEHGFSYLDLSGNGTYQLTNDRRDVYDSAELSVHQSFGESYEWMASYTRSRARSNAVLDFSINQPLTVSPANNAGPLGWDAPNRFLSWGYLPTPWPKWALAYLLETRDGFPFSAQTETGAVAGMANSYRFPSYFSLNLHAEYRFKFRGQRLALRGGFNNITNHNNFTLVNNVVGSPQFLYMYGSDGRHFVVRLRWIGKE